MAKRLQHRGGTTSQHSTFTGAVREVTVDTDKNTLVVHDGATAGGHPLATATNFKSTGIDDNATSTAITIDSSERVGIGTSSPNGTLDVRLASDRGAIIEASDSQPVFLRSYQGAGSTNLRDVGLKGSQVVFYTGATTGTSASERMYMDSNGQMTLTGSTTSFDTTASRAGLQTYYETDTGLATVGSYSSGGSTALSFHTSQAGAASSEKMRILNNGNVGINTSSPSSTLDVNGSIRGDLELAPGKEYSMTSGAGTGTAIFDTNISLTTFAILEVFYRGNSNVPGTASYNQTGLYYVQVGTGFNGSAVAVEINQTEVFKHVPFGSPPALTFSSVIFDGSSESSSVTSTSGCQIRIKIAGYATSATGGGTQVMIRRIF